MHTDIIRIQSNVNMNYLKKIYGSMDYRKMQSSIEELKNAVMPLYNLKMCEIQPISESVSSLVTLLQSNFSENLAQRMSYLNCVLSSCSNILQSSVLESFKQWKKLSDKNLFFKIADEMGFPIYMEVDSELQDRLIVSYRKNGNQ